MDNKNYCPNTKQVCSTALNNSKELELTNQRFDLLMKSLEDKMDKLSKKIDNLGTKLQDFSDGLDNRIDERIEAKNKTSIYSLFKWLTITLGGSTVVLVVGRLVLRAIGL